ncbi:hypothetical protein JCM6882_006878 [Rhodosporidiobolus microsporus]
MEETMATYPALGASFATLSSFVEAVQAVQPFPASSPNAAPPPLPQLVSRERRDKESATVTCQLGKRKPGRRLPGEKRKTDAELCRFSITAKLSENEDFVVSAFQPHSSVVHEQFAPSSPSLQIHQQSDTGDAAGASSTSTSPTLSTSSLPRPHYGLRDSRGKFKPSPAPSEEGQAPERQPDPPSPTTSSPPSEKFIIPLLPPVDSRYAHRRKRRRPRPQCTHEGNPSWEAWKTLLGDVQVDEQDEEGQPRAAAEVETVRAMSGKGALRSWGWWNGEETPSEDEQDDGLVEKERMSSEQVVRMELDEAPSSGDELGIGLDDSDPDFAPNEAAPPPAKWRRKSVSSSGGRARGRGRMRASSGATSGRKPRVRFIEPPEKQSGTVAAQDGARREAADEEKTFSGAGFLPPFSSFRLLSPALFPPGPIRPFDFSPVPQWPTFPPISSSSSSVLFPLPPPPSGVFPTSPAASFISPVPAFASPASSPETAFSSLFSPSTAPPSSPEQELSSLSRPSLRERRCPPPPRPFTADDLSSSALFASPQVSQRPHLPDVSERPSEESVPDVAGEGERGRQREAEEAQALEALLELSGGGFEVSLLPRPGPSRWAREPPQTGDLAQAEQPLPSGGAGGAFSPFASSSLPTVPRPSFSNPPSPTSPSFTLKAVKTGDAIFTRPPASPPATTAVFPFTPASPPATPEATASALAFKPRASSAAGTARRRPPSAGAMLASACSGGSKAQAVAQASAAQGVAQETSSSGKGMEDPSEADVERLRQRLWGKGGEQESGPLDRLYQPTNLQVRLNKLQSTDSTFSPPSIFTSQAAAAILSLLSTYPRPPRHRLPALQSFPTVHASPTILAHLPSSNRRVAFALEFLFGRSLSDGECVFLEKREKALWAYVRAMAAVAEVNERVRAVEGNGRSGRKWMERG